MENLPPRPVPKNPYLAVLRREYPEPLVALLAFILGIWLWDHYFGKTTGYEPGTEQVALVKIDRDLRLADAMADDPAWLRWMAGAERPQTERALAQETLLKLHDARSITQKGASAYLIIQAVDQNKSLVEGLARPDVHGMEDRLVKRQGSWWEARQLEQWEKHMPIASDWHAAEDSVAALLRKRALVARSAVWLLALAGFAFLPSTVRRMEAGLKAKPHGYAAGWTPTMGLTIFLVATLAWIGFGLLLNVGLASSPNIPSWLGLLLDSVARLLPSLIAIALIFRQPSHAIRTLGIDRKFHLGMVLGLFSLLTLLDQPLRLVFGNAGATEPGGGMSAGEAGWSGLFLALTSACIAAPIAEELLYRGVLFRSLGNRLGVVGGALISSAIFAILHIYDGYGLASVGIFGFACAVLYASTGSLTTVIFFHFLYNLAIKLPEWVVYHAPL